MKYVLTYQPRADKLTGDAVMFDTDVTPLPDRWQDIFFPGKPAHCLSAWAIQDDLVMGIPYWRGTANMTGAAVCLFDDEPRGAKVAAAIQWLKDNDDIVVVNTFTVSEWLHDVNIGGKNRIYDCPHCGAVNPTFIRDDVEPTDEGCFIRWICPECGEWIGEELFTACTYIKPRGMVEWPLYEIKKEGE
jgi:hypothetical protein